MIEKLKGKVSLFWILQIAGWSGYALDRYLSEVRFFPTYFIYLVVAFFLTLLLRPIYRWFYNQSPPVVAVGLMAVFCSIAAAFLWLLIGWFIFWLLGIARYPDAPWHVYVADTFKYTLIHHKPFLFLSWSALYFGIKYWQDVEQQQQRAMAADALAREAELKMLRYQINPHFLFNALNSIQALIREDPARAGRMINELSEFLRYSLVKARVAKVPLKDEIEAVRNYLAIEQIRFEDKLDIKFDINSSAEEFQVPGFLMHPLVENAIKYGMQTSAMPLRVALSAYARNGSLHLEVANTGRWTRSGSSAKPTSNASLTNAPSSNGTGIGLENVRQRLEQLYPGRHQFDVFERDGWVHAAMEIKTN